MLLRQFISASNAIEEIYIVKRENESDNEENPSVDKLLPETGIVPVSMTAPDVFDVNSAVEIKSEPEDEKSGNEECKDESVEATTWDATLPDVDIYEEAKLENDTKPAVKSEDEDDVPLAVRARRGIHRRRRRKIKKLNQSSSDTDTADEFNENYDDSDDEKRPRGDPKCYICDIKYNTRHELKSHLRKTHSEMLPFRCDRCVSGEQKSICSLNKHFEMHDQTKPFKCHYCEARFSSRIYRTAHQRRFHKDDLENDTIRNANRRFVCRYCNKRFAAKFNLERHEKNHEMKITDDEVFLNRRNKCYLCEEKPCDSKEALHDHLSIHVDKLPYTCEKCDDVVSITSVRLLNKHLASHEEPEKPIKCVYCNERFISVVTCQAHERTHVQEKEADEKAVAMKESERISPKIIIVDGMKRYECGYCGNSYSLLSTLRRHENIHTGKIQYICKVCGKIFNKSSCLLQHERTHSRNTPYKCDICGRGFKETIRLIEHRRIHSGERPFTCHVCFKRFRIKPLLKEHMLQCSASEIIVESKCRFCNSVFDCFRELAEHIPANHPIVISETQCEYCDLCFKDAVQLAEHENYHRNPNSIKCDVCGRIFKQISNLRRHQRLHSNDAIPFQCDLCGKSFSQAGALKVHNRIHSGEKPYKCELCDKAFYHSSTMNRHKRSHYKAKSKLFLFGDKPVQPEERKPVIIPCVTPIPGITLSQQQELFAKYGQPMNRSNSALNPVSVASDNTFVPQVPNIVVQQPAHQISLPSFEVTAGTALDTGATTTLEDGTSMYMLDTKLMIPQTIMQHQDDSAADVLNLGASIESSMQPQ